jgi:molybdopterin converting factor small subunit
MAVTFSMQTAATSTFTIRVLLFASYAESLGLDSIELTLEPGATVGDAVNRLRALPAGNRLPAKPLCAVNLKQVNPSIPLNEGDELALLPPMAGG